MVHVIDMTAHQQQDSSNLTQNNNGNDSRVHVNEMTSLQQQDSSDSTQNNNGVDSRAHVTIEMTSHQQEDSSGSTQNNNGNDRSLMSPDVEAQEKLIPVTALLEMGARILGVLVCGLPVAVLVQGGMVTTVETEDRVFVTVLFFLVCFRYWGYFCPQAIWSLTEATQSLSADNLSIANNIPQLVLPIRSIIRFFYWYKLISAMTCVVLSIMRLASQDFGQTEVANQMARDFSLNVFYGLALAEALVLLFALTFVPIMAMQQKAKEALFERVKPSQPAPLLDLLSLRESVNFSNPPESELQGLLCGINHHPPRVLDLLRRASAPSAWFALWTLKFLVSICVQYHVRRL